MEYIILVIAYEMLRILLGKTKRDFRYIRDISNPFEVENNVFIKHFRMDKTVAISFIEELRQFDSDFTCIIPFHLKILACLNFYATGSYQTAVGSNNIINISQPSTSRCVTYISELIIRHLGSKYIIFPTNRSEINEVKRAFQEKFLLPDVIGCIDCTHISIKCPPRTDTERPPRLYRNRKRFYSLNVEAVCDAQLRFLWVNAKFPGSCHDSAIWSVSPIRNYIRRMDGNNLLLGDSGYPLEPWLITPYGNPHEYYEELFNSLHSKARNTIERAFGVMKATFRCLLKERSLHYSPVKASYIINACFIVYNYLQLRGILPEFLDEVEDDSNEDLASDHRISEDLFEDGQESRNRYAANLL